MSADRALRLLAARKETFDLAFLDPPYALDLLPWALSALSRHGLLGENATVVCEHHGKSPPPEPPPGLAVHTERRYGDVALTLMRAEKGCRP